MSRQRDEAAVRAATRGWYTDEGAPCLLSGFRYTAESHRRRAQRAFGRFVIALAIIGIYALACSFDSHSSEGSSTAWTSGVER